MENQKKKMENTYQIIMHPFGSIFSPTLFLSLCFPYICFVFIIFLNLFLPSYSGVTTMLNFFTTSNGFRSTLPVVSNLTAMNVWDGVCMCFIYASLLEFVCVNYVGRKRPLHNVVYRPGENPVTQVKFLLIFFFYFFVFVNFFFGCFTIALILSAKKISFLILSFCSDCGTFCLYLFPSFATYASEICSF